MAAITQRQIIMATKATQSVEVVRLKALDKRRLKVTIVGTAPLCQHQWDEKAISMMREKKMGKKTKSRDAVVPEEKCKAATYFTPDGQYAVPVGAIREAIVGAAHKDIGIEKTLVRKAIKIAWDAACVSAHGAPLLPMRCSEPKVLESYVRVGQGAADLCWRPLFEDWEVDLTIEYDGELLQPNDIVNLVNRAGWHIGIGEMRPEKKLGTHGTFEVKSS